MRQFLSQRSNLRVWLIVAGVLAGGALLSWLDGRSITRWIWLEGWLAYSLLLGAAVVSLKWTLAKTCRGLVSNPVPWRAAWTAFLLRLAVGLALFWLLPVMGYAENEVSMAGYLYKDAHRRDFQAIALARSDKPLLDAFSGTYQGDQYGGMLAFSAGVYRYLSPSAHRPMLIVLLGSWAAGMGTALLWAAARQWLGDREEETSSALIPNAAAWIVSLYPEAVFLGASQMREPFVFFMISAAFYGLGWFKDRSKSWLWLSAGLLGLGLLQPPVALAAMVMLAGMLLVEAFTQRRLSWKVAVFLVGALVVGLVVIELLWQNLPSVQGSGIGVLFTWLRNNFGFQTHLTERTSGMMQYIIYNLGEQWLLPVVLVYGFAQPVLPAVLVEPSVPIWVIIGTLRAAGWYLLAPFFIYQAAAFSPVPQPRRALRLWLSLAALAWIMIAAANGGGDAWDNPRYRTIFLPWLAALAAWALWWARRRRDPWLWRWLAVEAIFVLFFLWWYITRYYPNINNFLRLDIWLTSGLTLGAAFLILVGGWLWDMRKS